MESLKEVLHIDLTWEKDTYKPKEWNLIFDKDKMMKITSGPWYYFNRFQFVETHSGQWRVQRKGNDPYIFEFKKKNLVGKKQFEIGFKKRFKLGMFNPSIADTFEWHSLEGNVKGMGWHMDGLEVVRFEKVGRSFTKFNYKASVVNGKIDESWLAAMMASGFLALK